jgi:hypothetical protein
VAAVELLVAQPRRQLARPLQLGLLPHVHDAEDGQLVADLGVTRVGVAPAAPLPADGRAVGPQRLLVPPPHARRRVVAPPVSGHGDRPQHLQGLDPLFAEAERVESAGRLGEVGVREEGLHLLVDATGRAETSERTGVRPERDQPNS